MPVLIFLFSFLLFCPCYADTMDNYMRISNQIPQMEIRADAKAQAWARSARTVMVLTDESIAETLLQANEVAKTQGKPLFCLPANTVLDAMALHEIILQTYNNLPSQPSDKEKITVSKMAWLAVTNRYPCQKNKEERFANVLAQPVQGMEHME